MAWDRNELLNALKTIQNVCKQFNYCKNCPLGNDDSACTLYMAHIYGIDIKDPDTEEGVWRAYKENM